MRSNHSTNNATKLLYLEDQYKLSASAHVTSISRGDNEVSIVLDQTSMYVKRGGQPGDMGRIEGNGFNIEVHDVVYGEDSDVTHLGMLTGRVPLEDNTVKIVVDAETRRLHSLWHSAGETVIVAAKMAGFDELVRAAIHYGPNQNRIEYQATLDKEQAEKLKEQININLMKIVEADTPITILNLTDRDEVIKQCGFWPDYVPKGEAIRVVKVRPDYTGRPCTGTHLARTSELGRVWVEKVKVKGGKVIVAYDAFRE
jgi:Ser-tRNA(Ala) deacylase AlaX